MRRLVSFGVAITFCLAAPSLEARAAVDPDGPLLGATANSVNSPEAKRLGITARQGAVITKVLPGHAADLAGLKVGDVVVACGATDIATYHDLQRIVEANVPGNRLPVSVRRGQGWISFLVTLGAATPEDTNDWPSGPGDSSDNSEASGQEPYLGVKLRSAGHPEVIELGIEYPTGAAVMSVTAGAPAALAGLRHGDLIVWFAGREIRTYEDLEAATLRCSAGTSVETIFVRGDQRLRTRVSIEPRPAKYPRQWYRFPENLYRFQMPGRWAIQRVAEADVPVEHRYDHIASTEGAYHLWCFHESWETHSAEDALRQYIREKIPYSPNPHTSSLTLGGAPAVVIASGTGSERTVVSYRICLVYRNRQYIIYAEAPPLSSTDQLPPVLADILETLRFRVPAVVTTSPPLSPTTPLAGILPQGATSLSPSAPNEPEGPAVPIAPPKPTTPTDNPPPADVSTPRTTVPPPTPPSPGPNDEEVLPDQPVVMSSEDYFRDTAAYQKEKAAIEKSAARLEDEFTEKNIEAAMSLTHPVVRARYRQIFAKHQDELDRVGKVLATRKLMVVTPEIAEYEVRDGGRKFRIIFEKIDGKWFLSSL